MNLSPAAAIELAPAAGPALTVGEVVARIRTFIERQFPVPIWIEGELSNCTYAASGHIYFSLVDPAATDRFPGPPGTRAGAGGQHPMLPCAFFRGANQGLKFKLVDGLKMLCFGQVTIYEGRAQYQLKVLRVVPKGKGELQVAFEQLKQRLQAEGLFEQTRKRLIPRMPERIGVVTSPSGSAVHDMVSKLRGWFHVLVLPVKVQGDGAAQEIVEAIGTANRLHLADVLIVGRGGGSIEDLWAFNEEPVARAIARSRIPVISAVGHQDDWTIADYVADLRASTPTDAAKQLVHEQEAFALQAREQIERLVDGMRAGLQEQDGHLAGLAAQLRLLHPVARLERELQRIQELERHLVGAARHVLESADRQLQGLAGRLQALSPLAVLARGYSITMRGGHVVTAAASLKPGEELETLMARGRAFSTVTRTTGESA